MDEKKRSEKRAPRCLFDRGGGGVLNYLANAHMVPTHLKKGLSFKATQFEIFHLVKYYLKHSVTLKFVFTSLPSHILMSIKSNVYRHTYI